MKIEIPNYRAKSRNQTITAHWRVYQKIRDEVNELMVATIGKRHKPIQPARITISAHYRGKRAIDTSNLDAKLWVDSIMHCGLLEDDTPDKNPEVILRSFQECGFDKVVIEIEKIN